MVYRLSRAMCEADPALAARMVRAQPFRAGPETLVRILSDTVAAVGTRMPGRSSDPGKERDDQRWSSTGMGKERIAQLVQETGAGLVEAKAKTDFEAATAVKSGKADYYIGACQSGAGGALGVANAILGSAEVVRLSGVGTTADPEPTCAPPWRRASAPSASATARSTRSCRCWSARS